MNRSNIPMLRQHSHPPAASSVLLSPTTTAAKSGIKLNDPALRNLAASTFSAAPNNAAGASTDITMAHANNNSSTPLSNSVKNSGNESSTMTTSRRKLPPFALVRTNSIDKENYNNSKISRYKDRKLPPPSATAIAKETDGDSFIDEIDGLCDSESVSHQPDAQMMNYQESESIMEDDNETSNGPTQQHKSVGSIRSPCGDDRVEKHDMNNLVQFEGDGNDSDGTEGSGDTVVAVEKPPAGLTQEELNKYYWEICYGPGYVPPPTILKSVPTKSCLSTKKTNRPTENASSMTPRRILHSSPSVELVKIEECKDDKTPKNNVTRLASSSTITRGPSAVKFGTNSAAEFDLEMPTTEMKHMPPNVVQEFFPNDKVKTEKDIEEDEIARETARNVSMLAEWDDDFDSIIDNDSNEDGAVQLPKRRRKQTPYKEGRRGRGNAVSRPRKTRRQSSIFGSAERGRSLLDISDETDEDSSSGLPFSVTINPDEYTSPSSNSLNDSMSSIEMPDASMKNDRESMSSTCISPSSLRSGSIMAMGSNRSSTSSSKETPKSARTSSSTILKTVHASGAFLPTNSPQGNELMPNQLKYSPKGSITGTNASPSSSDSLGSDIMGLFTKHSLEDETDGNLFCRQLSILSTHPKERFHTNMCDLVQWIAASGKSPLQFINDHVSKGMNLSTLLSLLDETNCSVNASMFCGNSPWMTSALTKDKVSFMERCFDFILRNLHKATNANSFCKERAKVTAYADVQTIASCLKTLEDVSSFSWSSSVELPVAEIALGHFESKSEDAIKEAREKLASLDDDLREATSMISQQLWTSQKLKARKRKASSKIDDAIESIKRLENQLTRDMERLNSCKRAREIFTAHLDVERASPISAISEEIRTTIFPSPVTHNGSDFTFSLLDGMAEVAMNVALDDETLTNIEIGCFLKDDGAASISLLKAVLLGYTQLDSNQGHGPFPLRNNLRSIIIPSSCESMHVMMRDLFADATHMFFKIDNLVRTLNKLESEAMCAFECDLKGNATISTSLATGDDTSLRIEFLFSKLLGHSWTLTTIPDDVIVTMAKGEIDATFLTSQVQQKAHDVLKSEHRDPSLLQRICDEVMEAYAQHGV